MPDKEDRYNIRALDRAIKVLSVLSDGKPRTLVELSDEIGLNSSTVFRILSTLSSHGYVQRHEKNGRYTLGLACLELARSYQSGDPVRHLAFGDLENLRDATSETVHLARLDKMEVVYVEKLQGLHAISLMSSMVGGRLPAYCTGLGKALIAHQDPEVVREYYEEHGLPKITDTTITDIDNLFEQLAEVRQRGYAVDCGEREPEVRCVAVPIFGIDEEVVAAISVSGPASRIGDVENNTELIEQTLQTARSISARLGARKQHHRN